MCTAVSYQCGDSYFGRNLDLERGYGERVVVTPRNFPIALRCGETMKRHFGMIGMAAVVNDYPLYFEATNERGLSAAGLNFPGNAYYGEYAPGRDNVTPFELIPWLLGRCATVAEAKGVLENLNMVNLNFSEELKLTPLHWMVSDRRESIAVESMAAGLRVWDNPFGVLTNNPPFEYHRIHMSNFMGLSVDGASMEFSRELPLENYSLGMGALGLPGDYSSPSRFVRACFVKENSVAERNERAAVNQFFHILDSVAMPRGCVRTEGGYEYTRYSSCCNADRGIYYYKTYDDTTIRAAEMHGVDLDGEELIII